MRTSFSIFLIIVGSRQLTQRSLHCLAVHPINSPAHWFQDFAPFLFTCLMAFSSSSLVQLPLRILLFKTFIQCSLHCIWDYQVFLFHTNWLFCFFWFDLEQNFQFLHFPVVFNFRKYGLDVNWNPSSNFRNQSVEFVESLPTHIKFREFKYLKINDILWLPETFQEGGSTLVMINNFSYILLVSNAILMRTLNYRNKLWASDLSEMLAKTMLMLSMLYGCDVFPMRTSSSITTCGPMETLHAIWTMG